MSMQPVAIFLGGEVLNNFETLGAVATHDFTVPLGRKWLLLWGRFERDVNATLDVDLIDVGGVRVMIDFTQIAAGAARVQIPISFGASEQRMWSQGQLLRGGQIVRITWGVAQTTPEVMLQVLEF